MPPRGKEGKLWAFKTREAKEMLQVSLILQR